MKRINVRKDESVAELAEKIIDSEEKEIVLVIPQGSGLKDSVANFRLLKREAEGAGKEISIESVDEKILKLARENRLENLHPLFNEKVKQSLSDIVSGEGEEEKEKEPKRTKRLKVSEKKKKELLRQRQRQESKEKISYKTEEANLPKIEEEYSPRELSSKEKHHASGLGWKVVGLLALVLVLAGGLFVLNKYFAKADLVLTRVKTPWQFQGTILADKRFSQIDATQNYLPLESFSQAKNITQLFPASGKSNVSNKAKGIITIYNDYSSAAQILVATTRFETSDGKIFRLDNQVIVPGAKVSGGKLTPSSIDAPATADKAGTDYNIGPIAHLTIPGFQGSARYQRFYGSLENGTSGGFIGEKAVPTAQDIATAEGKVTQILQSAFQNNFLNNLPAGFTFLNGASNINVTKLTANTDTDAQGNFSVFGEASFQGLAFKEDNLRSLLGASANKDYPNSTFLDLNLSYQNVSPDFNDGRLTFSLTAQGDLAANLSADDLKAQILNKKISDVRSIILGLPGLEQTRISVWPPWVQNIPSDSRKVNVVIN